MYDETAMFTNDNNRPNVSTAMHQQPVVSSTARRSWRAPEMEEVDYTETRLGAINASADLTGYSG